MPPSSHRDPRPPRARLTRTQRRWLVVVAGVLYVVACGAGGWVAADLLESPGDSSRHTRGPGATREPLPPATIPYWARVGQ